MQIFVLGHILHLLPEKTLWWPDEKILFISDVHLGKIEHFRQSGIPLPYKAAQHSLASLTRIFETYQPKSVYFLGDLFHSVYNNSVEDTLECFKSYSQIEFVLVLGNHDVLHTDVYNKMNMSVITDLVLDNFLLTHEPCSIIESGLINICGHVHPGVRIQGRGKQYLSLPCFYLKKNRLILPAFGYFTGKAIMDISDDAEIFAIGDGQVFKIPSKKHKV